MNSDYQQQKLAQAISLTKNRFPLLLPLLSKADISYDERIDTACVFPSGRILISPLFTANLGVYELSYILSHELMHLYYRTEERAGEFSNHSLVNAAHDFIINGRLSLDYQMQPPNGGLNWQEFAPLINRFGEAGLIPDGSPWCQLASDDDCEYCDETARARFQRRNTLVPEELQPDSPGVYFIWEKIKDCSLEALYALLKKLLQWLEKYPEWHINNACQTITITLPASDPEPESEPEPLGSGVFDGLDGLFGDDDHSSADSDSKGEAETAPQTQKNDRTIVIPTDWLGNSMPNDVRTLEEELAMFPQAERAAIQQKIKALAKTVKTMAELDIAKELLLGNQQATIVIGQDSGQDSWEVQVASGQYAVPWERALQRWMDETAPRTRSWTSASRRLGDRRDICLPGHARNGYTANFVLDTSGSMVDELPYMLGALGQFCQNNEVEVVRLLQCDAEVHFDEVIEVSELSSFNAFGNGGSDMSPAMERLAEDPSVQSVIVLTDGFINYPESVPYDVLWVLPEPCEWFTPPYGTVVAIRESPVLDEDD